jgi:hypothetical protein
LFSSIAVSTAAFENIRTTTARAMALPRHEVQRRVCA